MLHIRGATQGRDTLPESGVEQRQGQPRVREGGPAVLPHSVEDLSEPGPEQCLPVLPS